LLNRHGEYLTADGEVEIGVEVFNSSINTEDSDGERLHKGGRDCDGDKNTILDVVE